MKNFDDFRWADNEQMITALQPVIPDANELSQAVIMEIDKRVGKDCEDCPDKDCRFYSICHSFEFGKVSKKDLEELLVALREEKFSCDYAEASYYCYDCKEFFDEPNEETDDPSPNGMSMCPGHYTYEKCPYCGSDNIEEV